MPDLKELDARAQALNEKTRQLMEERRATEQRTPHPVDKCETKGCYFIGNQWEHRLYVKRQQLQMKLREIDDALEALRDPAIQKLGRVLELIEKL
jgi:hypothetical protein